MPACACCIHQAAGTAGAPQCAACGAVALPGCTWPCCERADMGGRATLTHPELGPEDVDALVQLLLLLPGLQLGVACQEGLAARGIWHLHIRAGGSDKTVTSCRSLSAAVTCRPHASAPCGAGPGQLGSMAVPRLQQAGRCVQGLTRSGSAAWACTGCRGSLPPVAVSPSFCPACRPASPCTLRPRVLPGGVPARAGDCARRGEAVAFRGGAAPKCSMWACCSPTCCFREVFCALRRCSCRLRSVTCRMGGTALQLPLQDSKPVPPTTLWQARTASAVSGFQPPRLLTPCLLQGQSSASHSKAADATCLLLEGRVQ